MWDVYPPTMVNQSYSGGIFGQMEQMGLDQPLKWNTVLCMGANQIPELVPCIWSYWCDRV